MCPSNFELNIELNIELKLLPVVSSSQSRNHHYHHDGLKVCGHLLLLVLLLSVFCPNTHWQGSFHCNRHHCRHSHWTHLKSATEFIVTLLDLAIEAVNWKNMTKKLILIDLQFSWYQLSKYPGFPNPQASSSTRKLLKVPSHSSQLHDVMTMLQYFGCYVLLLEA